MFRSPMVQLKRNHRTQALFLFFFMAVFLLNMFFVFPPMTNFGWQMQLTSLATTLAVLITFFYTSCRDAGSIK